MSGLNFFLYISQTLYHFYFVSHSFPLHFCFVFFYIWLLSFSWKFMTFSAHEPSRTQYFYLFTVWLASIFGFEYIHLRFTMLSLAMGSNFHIFYPRQPQQRLIFCTPDKLINCMQRKCISAVLWWNPVYYAPNIYPNVFNSFYRNVIYGKSHGIFTSYPHLQTAFLHISL